LLANVSVGWYFTHTAIV